MGLSFNRIARSGPLSVSAWVTGVACAVAAGCIAIEVARVGRRRAGPVAVASMGGGIAGHIPPELRHAPGHDAEDPMEIPAAGWKDILKRAALEFNQDRIPAVAAGVGFYGILALFPALAAFVSFFGLFADVGDARKPLALLAGLAPAESLKFIGDEMVRIAGIHRAQLSTTFLISAAVSIWSANAGIKALIGGLNVAYEERETRGFFKLNLASLGFTVGAIAMALVSSGAIVAVPIAESIIGLEPIKPLALLRWPVLLLGVVGILALLYRYGPSRPHARWRWVSPGSIFAGVAWLLVSVGFSFYVGSFGHYDRTYGSLGAVVGCMVWLWITVIVVLFGAELNGEVERQTGAGAPSHMPH
jgi:membrane protein